MTVNREVKEIAHLIKEINLAEKRGREVRMSVVSRICQETDPEWFQNYLRDYVWFDDKSCLRQGNSNSVG